MTDKYDLSSIDTLPAAPTSAPSKYDLGGIDAMPAASGFDKTASLFAASIGNPSEEAERRRLESDITRITGFREPVADIREATRRRQQLEADHVTRASPRTSLFLSAPENAAVAIQDAKTLAQIEAIIGGDPLRSLEIAAKRGAMSTGALGAKVGFDFPAVATDIIGESLRGVGVSDEYNVFKAMSASARRSAVATRSAIEYFTPEARNMVERAAASAGESAGMSLQLAPLAAATPQGAGMAAAFGLTTFAESYTKAREAGKGPLDSLKYAIPQGAFEGLFEMAPAAFLADAIKNAPGLKQFTLGLIGKEVPSELQTTLAQNLNDWVTFNPGKSVSDFIAEQPEALAETAIATVMGAGIQAGLIHGAQRVTGQFQVAQEERRLKQQAEVMQKLFEQAKNIKSDPVTFKSFMDGVTDNATVFVNADDLQQVLAQNGMSVDVLPTAAGMLAQGPSVTGDVEIPVGELMTAFAGTPAQEQIVQHTRVRQDDLSQAQWEQMGDIGAFLKSQTKEVQERQKQNEQFQSELDEIEASFTGQLPGVPNIATAGYGSRDQQLVGRMVRHFYAVAADRMGVSPKQVADLWSVKFPGAEQAEAAPALTQPATRETFTKAGIGNLLKTDKWAILTAENPGAAELSPEENAARNAELVKYMTEIGVEFTPVKGQYGRAENSFVVTSITPEQALAIGKKFDQESVLTRHGYVYQDGMVTPATGLTVHETPPEDYFTTLPDGTTFTVDLDFARERGLRFEDVVAEDLAQKKGAAKKKPAKAKPIPEGTAEAANIANANKIAATGKFDYIRDLKEQIQNAVRAAAQGADLSATTPEVRKYLTDLGTQEALAALQTNSNAVGWYDEKTRQALSVVALVHPEILTDPDARFTFIYALAVTSNGQRVEKNFELAERAYAGWKESKGVMPSDVGAGGPAGGKVHEALARYNDLVVKFGSPAEVEKFMLTEFTSKELAEAGFKKSGENVDTVVLGAAILGPKIGNGFFANLYGVFDRLTMDRWLMRTWGRWTGTLLQDNQAAVADEKRALKALVRAVRADKEANAAMRQVFAMSTKGAVDKSLLTAKASPWEVLVKSGNIEHIGDQLHLKSTYPPMRAVMQSSVLLDELRKSGNRLYNKLDGGNEAPGGGNQRNWIRAVFNDILQNVVESTGQKMEMADLQALLWYPEKRLYDSAKSDDELQGYEDDEAPDYANAAVALARSKGISDDAIAAALANPADRPAVVRPVAGGAVARELGSFADGAEGTVGETQDGELAQRADAAQRAAGAVAGPVVGIHYSQQPRTSLASSAFGSGMPGAERDRLAASKDPRIKQRVAFYVNTGSGITPESGVGSHAHVATLRNLYDADADALKIWRNSKGDMNAAESAVLDAGFDGYLTRNFGGTGAAVMLGSRNVDVESVKREDVNTTAEQPPSPEIPRMKQAAMAILQNTKLPFGQQSVESWKRDLERTDPDTASLIDWAAIPPGDYYKDQIAARLWQNDTWYYSALSRAMENAPAKVFGSGKAVAQWLQANAGKLAVKKEEIEATGITDWLETQPKVTKEQVVEFLKQGGVQIQEVVLGDRQPLAERDGAAAVLLANQPGSSTVKFEQYQLPGGEPGTYRELLITLPTPDPEKLYRPRVVEVGPGSFNVLAENGDVIDNFRTWSQAMDESYRIWQDAQIAMVRDNPRFTSNHFPGTPNILAHVRTNMRTSADGKRVLFIEEIQSDWAQKGRKEGFAAAAKAEAVMDGSGWVAIDSEGLALTDERYETREAAIAAVPRASFGVPSAPFVTDTKAWTALALKRMIAYAVEQGADSIAWTTGEQQAARYDLSKQVERVTIQKMDRDRYALQAIGLSGETIVDRTIAKPEDAEEYIGKEPTAKLIKDMGNGTRGQVSGLDLKVGGEGMKGYYDGIVPQVANDVLKKIGGGKVTRVAVATPGKRQLVMPNGMIHPTKMEQIRLQQPGFEITDAMREAVGAGLPLFARDAEQRRGSFNPLSFELRLTEHANRTTLIHELSHFFMAAYIEMAQQPNAPAELTEFVENLLGYLFKNVPGNGVRGLQMANTLGQKVGADGTAYKAVDVWSKGFRAWFGDSKAVDERGRPLQVFHGTAADITSFDPDLAGSNYPTTGGQEGLYFTDDSVIANVYAEQAGYSSLDGGENVVPVYLSLQNPIERKTSGSPDKYFDYNRGKILAAAKKSGADGVIVRGGDRNLYIVFSPDQIKSAISNTGGFQGPNILEQNGEPAQPGAIPEGRTNLERWQAMTLDQQRPYWEHFAEQWEQYAMTGKAPTKALQSAFSAFAKWMKSVYQSFKNFLLQNPQAKPLDPEITQYFDRMLATEAELEAAREERGYKALFKAAADAGMSPSQFADYMALDELQKTEANELLLSRSLRDMKWLSNAKSKAIKEIQAEADELRALVRAGVEEELADTPIRKAERWLRKGEMVQDGEQIKATAGFKLNAEIVKAMFPQGAVDSVDLAKLKQMMSSTGTQHPDDVAAIFGFRNGEHLVRELLNLQPFKGEASQLTDLRMLEEHGDLATPEAIEKAADAAIHNAAHLKMVATEVWALNSRIGSVAALTKAAKEFAKSLIGNTAVKKLSPSSYANAATRAGKMASRAVAKKETDVAAKEKRVEMINAAAAKEAYAAEAEVRAMMNRLRKIAAYSDKHSSVTSREFSVVQAVRAILGEFEIGSKGEKAQTYVATVSEYDPMLGARLKEVIDVLTAVPKPWQELTIDELRELHAEIGGLWTVAREIRTVELAGEKMTLDEARQQLLDKLSENRKSGKDGKAFSLTDAEIRSQDFMSFVARGVRPESWISMKDGNEQYGPWRRLIWNAIDRAQLGYNADKADKLKQLKALLETVAADMKDVQIDAPELGGTFGAGNVIGYSELLHAILHTGNESNKTKLLVGRGWGGIREDGTLDSTKWDAFMKRMWAEGKITKTHMDFVQGVWDLMESMKEGAQKAHRATTGRYFEEIQATEIVTPFGTYRGGYVPAIVDRRLVADADVRKALEESQTDVLQTFEKPAGGFTKSRVKNYNSKLELNIAALGRHIDQVMLFTHMSVPVRNVQRVLRGPALSKELSEQDRSALTKVIMPWLHGAATQTVTERGSMSYENLELLTKARSRAGAALMFANISNSVQQLTGFFPALLKTDSKELLFAAAKGWYKPRELAAHVSELSPYMKQRLADEVHAMAEEIDHILLNPTRFEKAQDWAIAHSYFLQMAVDSAMSPVIWQAKFNETIARGGSQQEAIDLADSAVRMTQGSNRAIDIAAMERGSPFYRLFMQFAGYFNTQINLVGEKIAAAKTLPSVPAKYGRIGMVLWLGWLAPAIASALVVQLFRGGVEDDDDDGEWLDDWLTATLIGAPFKYAAAAVPVFGQTIVAAMNSFNDKPYDDRISMSPAVSIVEGGYRGGKALVGAFEDPTKAGRAIRDIGTFLSLFTGVPITPVTKAIGYATDVETGKVAPTGPVDYGRGIITGTASPESKR